jgi:hypothetical protein
MDEKKPLLRKKAVQKEAQPEVEQHIDQDYREEPQQIVVIREGGLTKVALQYGLVMLVMAYLHAIQVPQLIQVLIDQHSSNPATHQPHVAVWDDSQPFDDERFMAQYVCDTRHTFGRSTLNTEPHLQLLSGFLAPGEAEHLVAIGCALLPLELTVAAGQ